MRSFSYCSHRSSLTTVTALCAPTGWELAQSLLRPRSIEVDDDGRVAFVSTGGFQRIGAQEALRHRFLRPAALHERNLRRSLAGSSAESSSVDESMDEPLSTSGSGSRNRAGSGGRRASSGRGSGSASASGTDTPSGSKAGSKAGSGWWGLGRKKVEPVQEEEEEEVAVAAGSSAQAGGLFSAAAGLWRGMQDRLFDLEARMIKTASETAKQTTRVQNLEQKVSWFGGTQLHLCRRAFLPFSRCV